MKPNLQKEILEDPSETVRAAVNQEELKLLNRSEQKELSALRDILVTLSPFTIRFIEQYIRTASAGQAARLAGSKAVNPEAVGYKLLTDKRVQQAIAIAMKKRIEAVGLDSIEVIMKIRRVYDEALEAGKFDTANKACELLQREIERAIKTGLESTKVGKVAAKLGAEAHNEEVVIDTELDRVLSIVSRIPTNKEELKSKSASLSGNDSITA